MKRILLTCGLVVGMIVLILGGGAAALFGPLWIHGRHIQRINAILAKPENYQPAAIALARLCETDPQLLKDDGGGLPPDWLPPDLGKLGPLEVSVERGTASLSTTSGLDEFNGYLVEQDALASTPTSSAWTLTFNGMSPMTSTPEYHFTTPKGDGFTELELVKNAVVELSRRKIAKAAKTDLALFDFDNPDDDRQRLLSHHRAVAIRLGLLPADTTSSLPSTRP